MKKTRYGPTAVCTRYVRVRPDGRAIAFVTESVGCVVIIDGGAFEICAWRPFPGRF